jgi:hypothetical protein
MGYTHGYKWTDEKIEQAILEAKQSLGLDRMPSRSELEKYFGDTRLTNRISKRQGFAYWAARLNLPIKQSETAMGKQFEFMAAQKILEMGYIVMQMPQNFPYDLLVENSVKIDVKTSKLYEGKDGNFFSFNLEKPFTTCDIYILYLCLSPEEIKSTLVIPSKFVFKNNQISVGQYSSIYDKYANRWDYITQFIEFQRSIKIS